MDAISETKSISDAAKKYGYAPMDVPLEYYELKEPTVTAVKKDGGKEYYTMNAKHGLVDSNVEVCWQGKKIISIKDTE